MKGCLTVWQALWLAISCLLPACAWSLSADEVRVAAGKFIGIITEKGDGPYQLILQEAARRAGITLDERVYPLKRAVKAFSRREVLAIYGMTDAVIEKVGEQEILTSYPLGVYKLYVFTLRDRGAISNFTQLKGLKVGGVIGYETYYRQLLAQGIAIDYVADEAFQLKKLEAGRIDAVIGFMPDWLAFEDELIHDPAFSIHVGYDAMTVWKSPQGQAFVDAISPALRQMHADGTLKAMLGGRFMAFDYHPSKAYEWVAPTD
jgi:ABC-type amino acid transport substrate-binding protein